MNTKDLYIKKLEEYSNYLVWIMKAYGSLSNAYDADREKLSQLEDDVKQLKSDIEKEPDLSAEQILLKHFPLLPKSSNKDGMDRILNAMQEYRNLK